MNDLCKKEAVRRLRNYDAQCRAAENLREELQQLTFDQVTGTLSDSHLKDRRHLRQRLRQIQVMKLQVERGLSVLTPQQRLILELMDICREKGNSDKLCQLLECELATVYRRRTKALEKFTQALFGA